MPPTDVKGTPATAKLTKNVNKTPNSAAAKQLQNRPADEKFLTK